MSPVIPRFSGVYSPCAPDPTIECSDYTYEPVEKATKLFPGNWETATILSGDTAAAAAFAAIQSKIPTNISARGTPANSAAGSGAKYPSSDPDCWWTYSTCTTPKYPGLPDDIINVPEPNTLGYGFDDGPDCAHNEFYDYLTAQNQKASESLASASPYLLSPSSHSWNHGR